MKFEARFYRSLGSLVRKIREESGLTQDQLAQKIGLTRTSITNLEHGRQKIQVHVLYELANALGVEPADLLPLNPDAKKDRTDIKDRHNMEPKEIDWVAKVIGDDG